MHNKLLKKMDKLTQGFYLCFVASVSYYFVLTVGNFNRLPLSKALGVCDAKA